uniref:KIB1-4 beta-propeller domain-containing protein n=1 Tax=Aegilops tauschii TaxID=37682 RepID=M8D8J6_AEGTA
MAPPFRAWADLLADLFLPIVDRLESLRDCIAVRGVCTAWRSALPPGPQSPYLLVLDNFVHPDDHLRDSTHAYALSILMQRAFPLSMLPCHSSCITGSSNSYITITNDVKDRRPGLLNSVTADEIDLLPLPDDGYPPRRLLLGPNPRPDKYTVVAIWDYNHYYVYGTKGCLPEKRGHGMDGGCTQEHTIEPLPAPRSAAAAAFDPPYDILAKIISFKRLFFFMGTLFQVWQNTRGPIKFQVRGGSAFIMSTDEILVLRYYPDRWPCWDVVKDLGGYSVFIGKNNTTVVQAEATLGVIPNSVYWIDCGQCTPWAFDMNTRTSKRSSGSVRWRRGLSRRLGCGALATGAVVQGGDGDICFGWFAGDGPVRSGRISCRWPVQRQGLRAAGATGDRWCWGRATGDRCCCGSFGGAGGVAAMVEVVVEEGLRRMGQSNAVHHVPGPWTGRWQRRLRSSFPPCRLRHGASTPFVLLRAKA